LTDSTTAHAVAHGDLVADVRQFHVDEVAEQALRVVGDADGDLAVAFDAGPLVGLEELEVAGDLAHCWLQCCMRGNRMGNV
jgi:hypothetical protein